MSIELWRTHATPYHHIKTAENDVQASLLMFMFQHRLCQRDIAYGVPPKERHSNGAIRFTMREIAEAFATTFTSKELSDLLRANADEWSTDETLLDTIKILDDFYRHAYFLDETRDKGRWEFWRLYIPGMSDDAIQKLIPKKYWSKSRHDALADYEDSGFSPLLKVGRERNYFLDFHERLGGVPQQDAFLLRRMKEAGLDVTNVDHMRFRFLRQWDHPLLIMYNKHFFELNGGCANLFDNPVRERMNVLKMAYPKLGGPEYRDLALPRFMGVQDGSPFEVLLELAEGMLD